MQNHEIITSQNPVFGDDSKTPDAAAKPAIKAKKSRKRRCKRGRGRPPKRKTPASKLLQFPSLKTLPELSLSLFDLAVCAIEEQRPRLAPLSLKAKQCRIRGVLNHFGPDRSIDSISYRDVQNFFRSKGMVELKAKTKNEYLTALRDLFRLATHEELINADPTQRMRNFRSCALDSKVVEPFTADELRRIMTTPTDMLSELRLFEFGCLMGLRQGELLALCWSDIDFSGGQVRVCRAKSGKSFKRPKTQRSTRTLKLTKRAIVLLREQFSFSGGLPARKIRVIESDNVTHSTHVFRPVFVGTRTLRPIPANWDYRKTFFATHLNKAGVAWRGANQARHTFASLMLSRGMPIAWIVAQLGHSSPAMLYKHYGKWMPDEAAHFTHDAEKIFQAVFGREGMAEPDGPPAQDENTLTHSLVRTCVDPEKGAGQAIGEIKVITPVAIDRISALFESLPTEVVGRFANQLLCIQVARGNVLSLGVPDVGDAL